jgi:DNA-directed RNA polymerase subunit RPC12/RpoP
MAVCRDTEGYVTYVCIWCGREQVPITIGGPNLRTPDATPLDSCPKGAVEGPWMDSENYWRIVEP